MTIALTTLLLLLALHLLGDFFLQSHWMAVNKSKDNRALAAHCVMYGLVFVLPFGAVFAGTNAALHFGVDFVTSRVTASLWQKQEWHWFFTVIGIDQFVHYVCLVGTHAAL